MARKSVEERPAGLQGVIILAILTVIIGAVLALGSLAGQEVRQVNEPPAEERKEAGEVYWVKGDPGTGTQRWRTVRAGILSGFEGEVVLSEGDLNQWARAQLGPRPVVPPSARGEDTPASPTLWGLRASASAPDFRFEGDRLSTGLMLTVFPPGVDERRMVYQLTGDIEQTENGPRFVHENSVLGRAPVGYIPLLSTAFASEVNSLFAALDEANELAPHLRRIQSASIADGELTLIFGPAPDPDDA